MATANAIVAQSGGPTAVINQSLVGVVETLRNDDRFGKVFGARHGVAGMVADDLVDLSSISQNQLDLVAATPSAALGSSRDKPDKAYCERIFEKLRDRDIRYFFYIGGNDSADTCRIVNEVSDESGYELRCFHVPKTIDNDLEKNDHTPGYASAARYVGLAFMGDNLDNRALPGVKINVVMGRHAGFLTAASALMRRDSEDGPHLIYVPEATFDLERFTRDVQEIYSSLGRCQIAVSEGIHDADGQAIGAKLISGEADDHGNVQLSGSGALGDLLAEHLKKNLTAPAGQKLRVRADTLGYPQRCYPDASSVDQEEARAVGRFAAETAMRGDLDGSIAIQRAAGDSYKANITVVRLTDVAGHTRHLPEEFIVDGRNISTAFANWLRPLAGDLPAIGRL